MDSTLMLTRNLFFCLTLAASLGAFGGEAKAPKKTGPKPTHVDTMQFGPFISYTIGKVQSKDGVVSGKEFGNKECVVLKGITVSLTPQRDVNACFDTDLLRYAVGWSGGFFDFSKSNAGQPKGDEPPDAVGTARFGTRLAPGVGSTSFDDKRERQAGPLPAATAHYKGLYVHDGSVIFAYTVAGRDILDMPSAAGTAADPVFLRTIQVSPSKTPVLIALCDVAKSTLKQAPNSLAFTASAGLTAVSLSTGKSSAATLDVADGSRAVLKIAPSETPVTCVVALWNGSPADAPAAQAELSKKREAADLTALCKAGKAQFPDEVKTAGTLGASDAPYTVDNLTLPDKNPWNSWMRIGAFDFFTDSTRAAACTLNGDVWTVSGIDVTLQNLVWKRFATGLYEPLGLKIVDDTIYVLGRDQITRLHDLDGDGSADFYENFCNTWNISPSYHAFSFDLWTDKEDNFYFANCGNQVEINLPGHGVMFKVSKDGSKIEEIARGFRAPNGMAVGPNGEIVCSDNEGFWMPSSKINWIKPNGFYGFPGDPRKVSKDDKSHQYVTPTTFDQPMCWIPHRYDTSSGGEAFITSDKWGPFKGQLIHTSYGTCTLYLVLNESLNGTMQGGTVKFPLSFPSGIMRARFNPGDGQLYLSGLRGWQTNGAKDGTFCRVRYTGKPVCMPQSVKTHARGIDITFSCPLDTVTAADAGNYAVEQWNYKWSASYGSPEFKVSNPTEKGHDPVAIQYVNLSADKKTISLSMADVKPVMQMSIRFKIKSADGAAVNSEIDYTIHQVAP